MEPATPTTEQPDALLDRLEAILDTQIEMARKSNFRETERLAEKTQVIITEIAESALSQQPYFKSRCSEIVDRYEKLRLILTTNKESVKKQLGKVGKGKKTMQAYRHKS